MLLVTYVGNTDIDFGENYQNVMVRKKFGSVKICFGAMGLYPEHDSFVVQKACYIDQEAQWVALLYKKHVTLIKGSNG
jgi:hypothetical protein